MTARKSAFEQSLSGTDSLSVEELRTWLEGVPGRADLTWKESATYPGEYGVNPWKITARWDAEPEVGQQ